MKTMRLALAILFITLFASFTAFAGEWKQDTTGWWYQNEDGTYPVNSWQWLDGNKDNIAECYYFDNTGYMVANSVVEGFTVDSNGAWTVNGVVQTKEFTGTDDIEVDVDKEVNNTPIPNSSQNNDWVGSDGVDYSDYFKNWEGLTNPSKDNGFHTPGKVWNWK